MDETQGKRTKRFLIGVIFIFGSIAYGWLGLFICNALGVRYGRFWSILGFVIYGVSWVTYGFGFVLAGPAGIIFVKDKIKKIFLIGKSKKDNGS